MRERARVSSREPDDGIHIPHGRSYVIRERYLALLSKMAELEASSIDRYPWVIVTWRGDLLRSLLRALDSEDDNGESESVREIFDRRANAHGHTHTRTRARAHILILSTQTQTQTHAHTHTHTHTHTVHSCKV